MSVRITKPSYKKFLSRQRAQSCFLTVNLGISTLATPGLPTGPGPNLSERDQLSAQEFSELPGWLLCLLSWILLCRERQDDVQDLSQNHRFVSTICNWNVRGLVLRSDAIRILTSFKQTRLKILHQSHTTSNPPSLSYYRHVPSKRTRSSSPRHSPRGGAAPLRWPPRRPEPQQHHRRRGHRWPRRGPHARICRAPRHVARSTRVLGEMGTGIQVSPNAMWLLLRWGLDLALRAHAIEPTAIVFRSMVQRRQAPQVHAPGPTHGMRPRRAVRPNLPCGLPCDATPLRVCVYRSWRAYPPSALPCVMCGPVRPS